MEHSRRNILQGITPHRTTHAGLWLDKYLYAQGDDQSKKQLVEAIAGNISHDEPYRAFYSRWKQSLKDLGVRFREAEVKTRLAINLGAENVLETSIALHRTYGAPYIPGSALKGLAASFARNRLNDEWDKNRDAYQIVFGDTDNAGFVTFFDALYIPETGFRGTALWPDIITVHHPEYYQGVNKPPADWDSPTPIPFLTATGKYLIALRGPKEWVTAAFEILESAMSEEGIGAKTSSGYGRLVLEEEKGEKVRRKGVVSKFNPETGKGRIRDIETDEMHHFDRSALPPGWSPRRKQKVYFVIYEGTKEILEIKERFVD